MEKHLFNKNFVVDGSKSEEYGDWVSKTAKLLKRPYMQMHNIFTKEKWTLEEIQRAYLYSTKHATCPQEVAWWACRRRRNGL